VHALRYFFTEAGASLVRGWRAAVIAVVTIAAGLFVLGFFLMVNANLQRIVARWTEAAALAVYVRDDATPAQDAAIKDVLDRSGLAAEIRFLSKDDARRQFAADFPDLAAGANALDHNPFPASFEVRLNARAQAATGAIDTMATTLQAMGGVADVRYDRHWLARLESAVTAVRGVGLLIIVLLAVASALTVASVVRLAAAARRDEIEIMQLVGAPLAYIRGPFIIEGLVQGGLGALVAIGLLVAAFAAVQARYAGFLTGTIGLSGMAFVPPQLLLLLVVGGMALGSIGGFIVARGVR
jgi:cell division transport system permease protein